MDRDRVLRTALWATTGFNLVAAAAFLFPESLGQLAGLPVPAPRIYTTMLAGFILLFGGAYAWMACQAIIDRPLVAFSAVGKGGVFALTLVFWLFGEATLRILLTSCGDLFFATIFAWWLIGGRRKTTSAAETQFAH